MIIKLLQFKLKVLARLVLAKYKPKVICVTGNIGKSSTKEAIYAVLSKRFAVRRNIKSYNNEIGVPLTVLGMESPGRSIIGWLMVVLWTIKMIFIKDKTYPDILVLELGADKPGDIKYLVSFLPVDIAVITAISEIPVHVEFFKDNEELVAEKSQLVKAVRSGGHVVLNYDFSLVKHMAKLTNEKVLTFGFDADAMVRASDALITTDLANPGVNFKLDFQGSAVPVRLHRVLGTHQIYPALAAAACGLIFDMNLVDISEGLAFYTPPPGRMRLIKGIKNTLIIDDSYNASPTPVIAALNTLSELSGGRRIAVLGDMAELGKHTDSAHRKVGKRAGEFVDALFTVGPRAKIIAESALQEALTADKVFSFDDAVSAGSALQNYIKSNDMILIKGSQSMRLEKIIEEIMAEPEKAGELLVRQDEQWKDR